MSGISPGPLLAQPSPPWRVTSGLNVGDAAGRVGASFFFGTVTTSAALLLAAASNVNGAVIRSAFCMNSASADLPRVFVGATAPSGFADFTRLPFFQIPGSGHSIFPNAFVAPGNGLWIIGGVSGNTAAVSWDVLP